MIARRSSFRTYGWPWIQTAFEATGNLWMLVVLVVLSIIVGLVTFLTFMAAWGWIPVGGLLISTAILPVQASQKQIIAQFAFAGDVIEGVLNSVVSIINKLLRCADGIILIYNFIVELLSSISRRVTEALNDILPGGFPVLFQWARFQRMEEMLRQEELYTDAGIQAQRLLRDAYYLMPNMTDIQQKYYIRWLEHEVDDLPFRNSNARFSLFPIEVFCDIIDGIVDFILDIVDIVVEFLLDFVDFVFEHFFDLTNGITGSFVLIFVQFILDTLLDEIPFGGCFKNLPYNLFACLCPWIYNEKPIYDFPFGQDLPVPQRIENALIGCICIIEILGGSVDLNSANGPIDLLIKCLGIDILISIFNSFLNFVTNVLQPLFNALKIIVAALEVAFNALLSAFDELADLADEICDLLGCKKRKTTDFRDARDNLHEIKGHLSTLRSYLDDITGTHERTRNLFKTYMEEHPQWAAMRERYGVSADGILGGTSDIIMRRLHAMNTTTNMIDNAIRESFARDPPRERVARKLEEFGNHPKLKEFREFYSRKYGADAGVHAATIGNVIRNTTRVASRALRSLGSDESIYDALGDIDFHAGVRAVRALAAKVREHNGGKPRELRMRIEARTKFMISSLFGGDYFPRAIREFSEKYPDDKTAIYDGLEFVRRTYGTDSLRVDAMLRAAQNGTAFDIRIETIRARVESRKTGHRAYKEEINDLKKMYERAYEARDPIGVSVALTAQGVTMLSTAVYGLGERIVVVGAAITFGVLTLLLQIFIMPIISILAEIVTSFILRITTSDEKATETMAFDFFSPFWFLLEHQIEFSFVQGNGLTFAQAFDTISQAGDILEDQANILVILFVRHYLTIIPNVIQPPKPLLSVQGRGLIIFFHWLSNVIFCDPKHTCGAYDSTFNNAPCRCPVDDGIVQKAFYRDVSDVPLQRYAKPGDPCVSPNGSPRGKDICYPFAPSGNVMSEYDININDDPKCDTVYGYDIKNVHWANAPTIGVFLRAVLKDTLISYRYAIRMIFRGFLVDWRVILLALMIVMIPCPCFLPIGSLLATLTVLLNVGTVISRAAGAYVRNVSEFNKDRFLVGGGFRFVLDNLFFECNVKHGNPFGDPCAGETQCFEFNVPAALWTTFLGLLIFGVIFHLLFPMGILALAWLVFRVFLIIPYAIFLFIWMIALSFYLANHGVGRVGVIFIAGRKKEHDTVHIGASAPAAHILGEKNINQHAAPVPVPFTGRVILRTSPMQRVAERHWFWHGLSMTGRSALYILKEQKVQFVQDALAHNPLVSIRGGIWRNEKKGLPNDVLLYSNEETGAGFPWTKYIVDQNNVPLNASSHYRIADSSLFYK